MTSCWYIVFVTPFFDRIASPPGHKFDHFFNRLSHQVFLERGQFIEKFLWLGDIVHWYDPAIPIPNHEGFSGT